MAFKASPNQDRADPLLEKIVVLPLGGGQRLER
jgi:hypothetical protein